MGSHLCDEDISNLLLDAIEDDDVIFNSSGEESDHVSQRSEASDSDVENHDFGEAIAEESSSDSDMNMPLSTLASLPSGRAYKGKDGTLWHKNPGRSNVRTRNENIISGTPGVKPQAKDTKTPLECFGLFINESMLFDIMVHTNERIRKTRDNLKSSNEYSYTDISITELKATIGLIYLAGLFKSGRQNLQDFWSNDGTGVAIFPMTMSLRRFSFIINHLRFDDVSTREERLAQDKLAPIRKLFDDFVTNCQLHYTPFENLTIDEELVAFRGRCKFRQYLPNKPAKYGIKIFALVDARTYYSLNLEIYAGEQPEGPYKFSNKPHDVVDRLVKPISGSGRNITMDNWFTSYPTFEHLLKNHKLTAVGTMKSNKACIPEKFKKNREVYSSLFGFQKKITLVSYIPKPRKNVFMLSSLHHDMEIDQDTDEKQKPVIITFYNKTKGGVDTVDKLIQSYDVTRNSRRWPLTLFFWMLNTAGINSKIIQMLNCPENKHSRRTFIKNLGLALIEPHLQSRKNNDRLSIDLRKRIGSHLGTQDDPPLKKSTSGIKRRCYMCPVKKDRKTQYICETCKSHLCLDHAIFECETCFRSRALENIDRNDED